MGVPNKRSRLTDDPLGYRTEEEETYYKAKDCIVHITSHILDSGLATESELKMLDEKSLEAVNVATKFANDSPFPSDDELVTDVYVNYP